MSYYHHPDVTSVPLHGNPAVESALVWVSEMENAAVRAFAAVASEVLARSECPSPE